MAIADLGLSLMYIAEISSFKSIWQLAMKWLRFTSLPCLRSEGSVRGQALVVRDKAKPLLPLVGPI